LVGHKSKSFNDCEVLDVFVGFEDFILTIHMYPFTKRVENFLILESDKGRFAICTYLSNKQIVSAKKLVELDSIEYLSQAAEPLSYMSYMERSGNQDLYVFV